MINFGIDTLVLLILVLLIILGWAVASLTELFALDGGERLFHKLIQAKEEVKTQ